MEKQKYELPASMKDPQLPIPTPTPTDTDTAEPEAPTVVPEPTNEENVQKML